MLGEGEVLNMVNPLIFQSNLGFSAQRLLTHSKQLSLVTFCNTTEGIGKNESVTYGRTDRREV